MSEPVQWRSFRVWVAFRPWQRHSLVLMIGGLVYIAMGLSLMTVHELEPRRVEALVVILRMASIDVWGLVFILSGVAAVLSSRWPTFSTLWGYMVLTGLSSAWCAGYILGFFLGDAPASNFTFALIWGLVAFLWWAISGLTNPDRRLVVRDDGD